VRSETESALGPLRGERAGPSQRPAAACDPARSSRSSAVDSARRPRPLASNERCACGRPATLPGAAPGGCAESRSFLATPCARFEWLAAPPGPAAPAPKRPADTTRGTRWGRPPAHGPSWRSSAQPPIRSLPPSIKLRYTVLVPMSKNYRACDGLLRGVLVCCGAKSGFKSSGSEAPRALAISSIVRSDGLDSRPAARSKTNEMEMPERRDSSEVDISSCSSARCTLRRKISPYIAAIVPRGRRARRRRHDCAGALERVPLHPMSSAPRKVTCGPWTHLGLGKICGSKAFRWTFPPALWH
jgi:hypothetical protein